MKEVLATGLVLTIAAGLVYAGYHFPKLMEQYSYTDQGWSWNRFSKIFGGVVLAIGSFIALMLLPT